MSLIETLKRRELLRIILFNQRVVPHSLALIKDEQVFQLILFLVKLRSFVPSSFNVVSDSLYLFLSLFNFENLHELWLGR